MASQKEYWVQTTDGQVIYVTATTASEASRMVQAMGHEVKLSGYVGISTPPAEYTPKDGTTPATEPKTEEGLKEFTVEQRADYNLYVRFLKTDEGLNWPRPQHIGDFVANIDKWATERAGGIVEGEGVPPEETSVYDEYAVPPEEAARRREEAYEESRYAAEERYREPARYSETFAGWVEGQGGISEALRGYVEGQFPSLRAEYESTLPRETGFATREEARAEAAKREKGWAGWLQSELPEVRQEYYMQRPYARGERYAEQSPTLRAVNW